MILSYLPLDDLLTADRVCLTWHAILRNTLLATQLFLRTNGLRQRKLGGFPYTGLHLQYTTTVNLSPRCVAMGLLNRCSIYQGVISYHPNTIRANGAEAGLNPVLFQIRRTMPFNGSWILARSDEIDVRKMRKKIARKSRKQKALPCHVARGLMTREMFLSQPAETAVLVDVHVIVDYVVLSGSAIARQTSKQDKLACTTSVSLLRPEGVRLGDILAFAEESVQHTARGLKEWKRAFHLGSQEARSMS